jgi:uncharacterized repeat protein (TIGR03803 family)
LRFYGTTRVGGAYNQGTVFSLNVGDGPFVQTLPIMGSVGTSVEILGTDLTGASSVRFGGVPAIFTINATATGISTTVPPGATTGMVQVVTAHGTFLSNMPFEVLP